MIVFFVLYLNFWIRAITREVERRIQIGGKSRLIVRHQVSVFLLLATSMEDAVLNGYIRLHSQTLTKLEMEIKIFSIFAFQIENKIKAVFAFRRFPWFFFVNILA